MYRSENFFPKDVLNQVKITPNIKTCAEIFRKKMNFQYMSHRGVQILKRAECETVGDVFYFMLDHHSQIGRHTAEEILLILIETILPSITAIEGEKAFLLSQDIEDFSDQGMVK